MILGINYKVMRLNVLIKILTVFSISLMSAAESQPLKWGYVNFAPYHYSENNKVEGSIAKQVESIFKKAGIEYSAFELPNKRVKLYIEQGYIDFTTVIDSFISNPNLFLKSDLPIYKVNLGAICLKSTHQISSLDHLKNLQLILMSGYTYGQDRILDDNNGFDIAMSAKNHENAIKALTYKRGDCVLGYQSPFLVEEIKYPETDFYFYLINELPVYLYLNKNVPNAHSIMQTINESIYKLQTRK